MSGEVLLYPLWVNFQLDHGREWGNCWHCGGRTRWVDLDFVAYLHPGVCNKSKWLEFDEDNRRAGPIAPWDPHEVISFGSGQGIP